MDWFTRKVLAWRISNTPPLGVCVQTPAGQREAEFCLEVNRAGFTGGWFIQRLSDHIECVQVCIERLLCFCGRDVSDGAEKAAVVIPIDL